jgi:chromosome partitioning protein
LKRAIVVMSQKGGVGKTTIFCHLAHAAARTGARVLAIDLDTQCNASSTLTGTFASDEATSSSQLFTATDPGEVRARETENPGISVLTATRTLDWLDRRFEVEDAFERRSLVRALPYDILLFDTPPAVGLRHLAPLAWCDVAVIPIEPCQYSLDGLAYTLESIREAQRANPTLRIEYIINKHIAASANHTANVTELASLIDFHFPPLTARVAIANAQTLGLPVWAYKVAPSDLKAVWLDVCSELVA